MAAVTRAEVLLELVPVVGDVEEILGALEAIVNGEGVDIEEELAKIQAGLVAARLVVDRVRMNLEDSPESS